MQKNRNTTPVQPAATRRNLRPILKSSLVSDRLGAQGFGETAADRTADATSASEKGGERPGQNAPFKQN